MKVATAREMQDLDRKTIEEHGIAATTLMENAGLRIVEAMEAGFGAMTGKTITVVSGKGNNGGDGLVAARLLRERGAAVRVFLPAPPDSARGDARLQIDRYRGRGGRIEAFTPESLRSSLSESDFIVDALFGTGLSSPLTGPAEEAVRAINEARGSRTRVVSVDIPSGVHSDTGRIMGRAVMADLTVALGLPKRGHFLFPGAEHAGRLTIVDIGIPPPLIEAAEIPVRLLTAEKLAADLRPRPNDSHKGSFGHAVVIGGSTGKGGAAVLAGLAALRTGAGLVTLATPRTVEAGLSSKPAELMTRPLPETSEGALSSEALEPLLKFASDKTVVAIGPGLSTHPETASLVHELAARMTQPMVIDADGLNALAGHLDRLREARAARVLTPHPGEMGRLTGLSIREIQTERLKVASDFAQQHRVILVLKGAHTVVATPEGGLFINATGNPGMATAGTGDVLTGMIAGLISQGYAPAVAAAMGVYLHGRAGDLAAERVGQVGLIATDLIDRIPKAYENLAAEKERS